MLGCVKVSGGVEATSAMATICQTAVTISRLKRCTELTELLAELRGSIEKLPNVRKDVVTSTDSLCCAVDELLRMFAQTAFVVR